MPTLREMMKLEKVRRILQQKQEQLMHQEPNIVQVLSSSIGEKNEGTKQKSNALKSSSSLLLSSSFSSLNTGSCYSSTFDNANLSDLGINASTREGNGVEHHGQQKRIIHDVGLDKPNAFTSLDKRNKKEEHIDDNGTFRQSTNNAAANIISSTTEVITTPTSSSKMSNEEVLNLGYGDSASEDEKELDDFQSYKGNRDFNSIYSHTHPNLPSDFFDYGITENDSLYVSSTANISSSNISSSNLLSSCSVSSVIQPSSSLLSSLSSTSSGTYEYLLSGSMENTMLNEVSTILFSESPEDEYEIIEPDPSVLITASDSELPSYNDGPLITSSCSSSTYIASNLKHSSSPYSSSINGISEVYPLKKELDDFDVYKMMETAIISELQYELEHEDDKAKTLKNAENPLNTLPRGFYDDESKEAEARGEESQQVKLEKRKLRERKIMDFMEELLVAKKSFQREEEERKIKDDELYEDNQIITSWKDKLSLLKMKNRPFNDDLKANYSPRVITEVTKENDQKYNMKAEPNEHNLNFQTIKFENTKKIPESTDIKGVTSLVVKDCELNNYISKEVMNFQSENIEYWNETDRESDEDSYVLNWRSKDIR